MLTNQLYIDGVDAGATYGVGVVRGGYNALVQYPAMKAVKYIDWPEENGVEPDLLNPQTEAKKTIRINFACTDSPAGFNAFIAVLQNAAHHTFYFKEIGVAVPLRYKSVTTRRNVGGLETFSVDFALDAEYISAMEIDTGTLSILTFNNKSLTFNNKLLVYTVFDEGQEGHSHVIVPDSGVLLDSHDLSYWRCYPLKGTREAVTHPAPLKDNLTIDVASISGQLYPDEYAVKGQRSVNIPLLLRADIPALFWESYISLLETLTATGNRVLTYNGVQHKCYYVNQTVNKFRKMPGNVIWCEFTLQLMFYEGD